MDNNSNKELQLAIINKKQKNESYSSALTMYTAGSIVGASVSAIVYSSIVTSGEITGSLVQSGINLGGSILGYGTDVIVGQLAGNSIRSIATVSSAIAGPTITSSSRTVAAGVSLIAGAVSAITTSVFIYGAKEASLYIYSKVEDYKQHIAEKIQHPSTVSSEIENMVLETAQEYDDCVSINSDDNDDDNDEKIAII